MKCPKCGKQMESLKEWLCEPHVKGGERVDVEFINVSRVVDGVSEEREYDMFECSWCGYCKVFRVIGGESD